MAQNAPFYVDEKEKKNTLRIYVSQFPPNWHLPLFHTLLSTLHVGVEGGGGAAACLLYFISHRAKERWSPAHIPSVSQADGVSFFLNQTG